MNPGMGLLLYSCSNSPHSRGALKWISIDTHRWVSNAEAKPTGVAAAELGLRMQVDSAEPMLVFVDDSIIEADVIGGAKDTVTHDTVIA